MTIKAFQQYMDMFYQEHPMEYDMIGAAIQEFNGFPEEAPLLRADRIYLTDDNILIFRHPAVANGAKKQHTHDFFELIYVSRGHCIQKIGDTRRDLYEGDMCLLNPYTQHVVDTSDPSDLMFNIMMKPSLFQDGYLGLISSDDFVSNFFVSSLFNVAKQQSYLYFPRKDNSAAINLVQSLIIELHEQNMLYQRVSKNYLSILLSELARNWQINVDQEASSLMENTSLTTILQYINEHKQDVTLTSVAEEFHYHPKYLSSLIKKYTDKSFSEIVQDAKMQEICFHLKNTNISIDELSKSMGYYDRSYFNRAFKKRFQMSPSQYREIYRREMHS